MGWVSRRLEMVLRRARFVRGRGGCFRFALGWGWCLRALVTVVGYSGGVGELGRMRERVRNDGGGAEGDRGCSKRDEKPFPRQEACSCDV
jgi:hypothetical protein